MLWAICLWFSSLHEFSFLSWYFWYFRRMLLSSYQQLPVWRLDRVEEEHSFGVCERKKLTASERRFPVRTKTSCVYCVCVSTVFTPSKASLWCAVLGYADGYRIPGWCTVSWFSFAVRNIADRGGGKRIWDESLNVLGNWAGVQSSDDLLGSVHHHMLLLFV